MGREKSILAARPLGIACKREAPQVIMEHLPAMLHSSTPETEIFMEVLLGYRSASRPRSLLTIGQNNSPVLGGEQNHSGLMISLRMGWPVPVSLPVSCFYSSVVPSP